jgi:16S rRNA (uracil1498-N3)-methyltransferase
MPVFFIHSKQISDNHLYLSDILAKHLGGALRHRVGDRIVVVDEHKVGYVVELLEVNSKKIMGRILETKVSAPTRSLSITLGQALLKTKKMDWILQKATELGVSRIIPMLTERTVVQPKTERIEHQQHRWEEILKEAAQQSGCWEIPEVDPPTSFARLVERCKDFSHSLIPWEGEFKTGLKQVMRKIPHSQQYPLKILVLIGPEGGFSKQEIEMASRYGVSSVSLGWRILRAETACLATLTILQYELGEIGCEHR